MIKQIWKEYTIGRRLPGKSKKCWKDQVKQDTNKIQVLEEDAESQKKWKQLNARSNSTWDISGHCVT